LDAIRALDENGAAGLLRQVVQLYFESTPRLIAELRRAQAAGQIEAVRNAAHSLKSSSATLGASRLAEMCKTVEHAARAGTLPADLPSADDIEREFVAARRALECEIRPSAA
jgi:HPt (histidine-containing phosphotransfer) domain-containing protein